VSLRFLLRNRGTVLVHDRKGKTGARLLSTVCATAVQHGLRLLQVDQYPSLLRNPDLRPHLSVLFALTRERDD